MKVFIFPTTMYCDSYDVCFQWYFNKKIGECKVRIYFGAEVIWIQFQGQLLPIGVQAIRRWDFHVFILVLSFILNISHTYCAELRLILIMKERPFLYSLYVYPVHRVAF